MIGITPNDCTAGGGKTLPAAALHRQRGLASPVLMICLALSACGSGYGSEQAERKMLGEERALSAAAQMLESRDAGPNRQIAPDPAATGPVADGPAADGADTR